MASFVDGRRQVLATYDDLRERTRAEGDAVALGGAYSETLTRHAVLLKQAEAFRARPDEYASLLAQRGGIARKDLDAFEDRHARARRYRRAATMRHVHRIKKEAEQEAQQPKPELRHTAINIYSQIGLVMLIGIMAKNGILVVEFADQLRDRGFAVREAIETASKVRLRPIVMTMISTVLGWAAADPKRRTGW